LSTRFVALSHRDFRLLWIGQLISTIGSQMSFTAINWHIYRLLSNTSYSIDILGRHFELGAEALGLGILGMIRVLPIIFFSMLGGMVADTHDRRQILLWTELGGALVSALLAITTLTGNISLGIIYLLTALSAAVSAFDTPARQAIVPQLVPKEHLTNAISLNTLDWQIGTIIGPAIAGALIASLSIGWVYAINSLAYLMVLALILMMSFRGKPAAQETSINLRAMFEGFRFVRNTPIIWSTMILDFWATFFSSARTMLPIVAGDLLQVGPVGYGVLSTAQSVGSVIAGLILSLRREIYHQGIVLLVSVAIYGIATALFGVSKIFVLSYILFALTGAGDTVSTVIRGTVRQILTPDHLRGRMVGVNMIFFMGGPQLGELEAGLVASLLGVPFAIVSGGVATVLITLWVAAKYPSLRQYKSSSEPELAIA